MRKQIATPRLTICLPCFLHFRGEITWARPIHGVAVLSKAEQRMKPFPATMPSVEGEKNSSRQAAPPSHAVLMAAANKEQKRANSTIPTTLCQFILINTQFC